MVLGKGKKRTSVVFSLIYPLSMIWYLLIYMSNKYFISSLSCDIVLFRLTNWKQLSQTRNTRLLLNVQYLIYLRLHMSFLHWAISRFHILIICRSLPFLNIQMVLNLKMQMEKHGLWQKSLLTLHWLNCAYIRPWLGTQLLPLYRYFPFKS